MADDDFNVATAGTGQPDPLSAQTLTQPLPQQPGVGAYQPQPAPQPMQFKPIPQFTPQGGGGGNGRAMQDQMNALQTSTGLEGAARAQQGDIAAQEGEAVNKRTASQADYDVAQQKARDQIANAYVEDHKQKLADYQQSIQDALHKTVAQGGAQIDPNQFWANKSTGSQIGLIIAQALGGFANGFSGGKIPNTAAQIIQSRIQQDIQAQQANADNRWKGIGASKNLIDMARESNLDRMHEIDAATAAGDHIASLQIDGMKSQFQGQAAQAGAQAMQDQLEGHAHELMLGQLNQVANRATAASNTHVEQWRAQLEATNAQNQQIGQQRMYDLTSRSAPGPGQGSTGGLGLDDASANQLRAMSEEKGKTLAHLGPNMNVDAGDPAVKTEMEQAVQSAAEAAAKVKDYQDFRKTHSSWSPQDRQVANVKANAARAALVSTAQFKRLSPELENLTADSIPPEGAGMRWDPTGSIDAGLTAQLGELKSVPYQIAARRGFSNPVKGGEVPKLAKGGIIDGEDHVSALKKQVESLQAIRKSMGHG